MTTEDRDAVEEAFKRSLLELFAEAYEGKTKAHTWFTGDEGVFRTLEDLSAEKASRRLGGASVAAHAEHLRWSLALANAFARGEEPQDKWSENWSVDRVDATAWDALRVALRQEYETLRAALEGSNLDTFDPPTLTGILALVPLSLLRQKRMAARVQ